jgi:DNA-binding transcriptional MocR family regulator
MTFRYQALAENIEAAINSGVYPLGARLPSIRQIGQRHGVSMTTATQAYARLEEQGLIETRPKSGHFVSQPMEEIQVLPCTRPRQQPGEVAIAQLAMDVVASSSNPQMISLAAAIPGPSMLPLSELAICHARAARMIRDRAAEYEAPMGTPELRAAISRKIVDLGWSESPDNIIITNGAQEALVLALGSVTKPGDIVAVESPTYFGIIQALEALNLRALEIPTDPRRGIDANALEAAIRKYPVKACSLMPNLQNPLGFKMSDADKEHLVKLLARNDIPLVEDGVFGALSASSPLPRAAKSFDRADNVIFCSSFSKTVSAALRIGWLVPGRYRDQIIRRKFLFNFTSPTVTQLALAEFLKGNRYRRVTQAAALAYQNRLRVMRKEVVSSFPDGSTFSVPQGGYYLWVKLPDYIDAAQLQKKAFAQGISFAPGKLFTRTREYDNSLRLSVAAVETEELREAIFRLGAIADTCRRVAR